MKRYATYPPIDKYTKNPAILPKIQVLLIRINWFFNNPKYIL
jgi:hypothetical protein